MSCLRLGGGGGVALAPPSSAGRLRLACALARWGRSLLSSGSALPGGRSGAGAEAVLAVAAGGATAAGGLSWGGAATAGGGTARRDRTTNKVIPMPINSSTNTPPTTQSQGGIDGCVTGAKGSLAMIRFPSSSLQLQAYTISTAKCRPCQPAETERGRRRQGWALGWTLAGPDSGGLQAGRQATGRSRPELCYFFVVPFAGRCACVSTCSSGLSLW